MRPLIVHTATCDAVIHGPARRVRCSCGADPDDDATPARCPMCGRSLIDGVGIAWSTVVAEIDGRQIVVVTCDWSRCIELARSCSEPGPLAARPA